MAEFIDPPTVWAPFGAFSMAAIQGDGHMVHLKGEVALDKDGQIVGLNDMNLQVRQTLQNIRAVLDHLGGRMNDNIALTQHVTDIDAFMAAGEIRQEFFQPPFPVTTTVEVSRLYDPRLLVEITTIAEIRRDRFTRPQTTR